jgi:arsenate reductase
MTDSYQETTSVNEPDAKPENGLLRVLFVCTHNSARSQLAEGLLRQLGGDRVEVYSAGSHPTRLHPETIETMESMGIDVSKQYAKHTSEFAGQTFDYVITVCAAAKEACPTLVEGDHNLFWGFADPTDIQDADERAIVFEQTAQRLKSRIEHFLDTLT